MSTLVVLIGGAHDGREFQFPDDDPVITSGTMNLPEFDRAEIQHFFEIYKTLEPGKSVEGATWVGRADAEREIKVSWQRAKDAEADESEH